MRIERGCTFGPYSSGEVDLDLSVMSSSLISESWEWESDWGALTVLRSGEWVSDLVGELGT